MATTICDPCTQSCNLALKVRHIASLGGVHGHERERWALSVPYVLEVVERGSWRTATNFLAQGEFRKSIGALEQELDLVLTFPMAVRPSYGRFTRQMFRRAWRQRKVKFTQHARSLSFHYLIQQEG